jgi:probable rRNA maturation factor
MDIAIHIEDAYAAGVEPEALEKAVLTTVQMVEDDPALLEEGSLSLTVTSNELVQQLNLQYLGIDAPTDVLSFENTPDADFPDVDVSMAHHLGDIVIAYPTAEAQAAQAGHKPVDELVLLAVHGTLHLLGFDHDSAENKAEMWAVQQRIMAELGLAHVQPTEKGHDLAQD